MLIMPLTKVYHNALDPLFVDDYYPKRFKTARKIYGHWSAGKYGGNFPDYHVMTLMDDSGKVYTAYNADVMTDLDAHTSGRNTDSIGVAIGCMYGGGVSNLGSYTPTPAMIMSHLNTVADIMCNHNIPFGAYTTHQEAADMIDYKNSGSPVYSMDNLGSPPYGPIYGGVGRKYGVTDPIFNRSEDVCCRWDWYCLINVTTLNLVPYSSAVGSNYEFYPDWFRGQLSKIIQERTRSYWGYKSAVPISDRTHGEGR